VEEINKQPFQDSIDLECFFSGAGRRETVDEIKSALSESVPLVLLIGSEGSGKTMICRMVEAELSSEMIPVFLPRAVNSFDDMVTIVLQETGSGLDFDPQVEDRSELLTQVVASLQKGDRRLVVFFDEAEKIYLATLERVRKLLDLANEEKTVIQFVFSGQELFEENLEQLSIVTFKDAEERRFAVSPLDEEDSYQYLNHCLSIAFGDDAQPFSRDMVDKISSRGTNFKRLNQFALESFQSERLDTSFLSLIDTEQKSPSVSTEVVSAGEPEPAFSSRSRDVNLDFLRFRSILPTWVFYSGGLMVVVIGLVLWFGSADEPEQPEEVSPEVPIIELERVVPLDPSPGENIVVETTAADNQVVVEEVDERAVPSETGDVQVRETPSADLTDSIPEEKVEVPTVTIAEPRTDDELTRVKRSDSMGAGKLSGEDSQPAPTEVTAADTGVPSEEEQGDKEKETSIADSEASQPDDLGGESTTGVILAPAEDVGADREAATTVTEKESTVEEEQDAETITNVTVEPLKEKEEAFSPEIVKETRLPEKPLLPEPIILIDDEKKYKGSKKDRKDTAVTVVPEKEKPSALTDKEVDALFLRRIAAGARWLVGGGNGKYTVQLMVLTSDDAEESLKKMLKTGEFQPVVDQLYVLRRTGPDPTVMVFYGEYPNLAAARNSRNNLPVFLRKHSPYAISVFGAVQKATTP